MHFIYLEKAAAVCRIVQSKAYALVMAGSLYSAAGESLHH
jgi:hypothetical protein